MLPRGALPRGAAGGTSTSSEASSSSSGSKKRSSSHLKDEGGVDAAMSGLSSGAIPRLFGASEDKKAKKQKKQKKSGQKPDRKRQRTSLDSDAKRKNGSSDDSDSDDSDDGRAVNAESLVGDAVSGSGVTEITPLTVERLFVGMTLLGSVTGFTGRAGIEQVAEVALPGNSGLRGKVALVDVSDVVASQMAAAMDGDLEGGLSSLSCQSVRDVLQVGQVVRVAITSLADASEEYAVRRDSIRLSLRGTAVNDGLTAESVDKNVLLNAAVRSVEDHGCVLDCGIPMLEVFYPKPSTPLRIGQPLVVSVTQVKSDQLGAKKGGKKIVYVTGEPEKFAHKQSGESLESLRHIKAGTYVTGRVTKVLGSGLVLQCMNYFTGTVDELNVANYTAVQVRSGRGTAAAAWLSGVYEVGQRVHARVMWVDVETKTLGVSLRKHIVDWRPFNFLASEDEPYHVGDFLENLHVTRILRNVGAMFKLNGSHGDQPLVFVHGNNLQHGADSLKKLKPGASEAFRARVLGFDYLHGVLTASMLPDHLNAELLTLEDVKPGMSITGTISDVQPSGVLVDLTTMLRGRFNKMHMADSSTPDSSDDIAKKFHKGQKVRVRVLSVDKEARRVHITHKQTLVKSKESIIADYDETLVGSIAHGFVVNVAPKHILISFYGGVVGIIGLDDVPSVGSKGSSLEKLFHAGQVVRTKVLSVSTAARKMRLTLNLDADVDKLQKQRGESQERARRRHALGDEEAALEAIQATSPEQTARLIAHPDAQIGSVIDKNSPLKITFSHASADSSAAFFLVQTAKSSKKSTQAACWAKMDWWQLADSVELAKSMCEHLASAPRMSEWTVPSLVVDASTDSIVCLHLSCKPALVAAAASGGLPKRLADLKQGTCVFGYVRSVSDVGVFVELRPGEVALAHLSEIDKSKLDLLERFPLGQTVRAFVVEVSESKGQVRARVSLKRTLCSGDESLFLHSMFESSYLHATLFAPAAQQIDWTKFKVNDNVEAKVVEASSIGSVFSCVADKRVSAFGLKSHCSDRGAREVGNVLQVQVIDVNFAKRILDVTVAPESPKQGSLHAGQSLSGTVLLVKKNCLVVRLKSGRIVFVPLATWNQAQSEVVSKYSVGQAVTVLFSGPAAITESQCPVSRDICVISTQKDAVVKDKKTLIDTSFPGSLAEGADISLGDKVKVKVLSKRPNGIIVALGPAQTAKIHPCELSDDPVGRNPVDDFNVGDVVQARVIYVHTVESREKELAITHKQNTSTQLVVGLSTRKSVLKARDVDSLPIAPSLKQLKRGDVVNGIIQSVTVDALWVNLSHNARGRVFILDASSDLDELSLFTEHFRVGEGVRCRVISANASKGNLDLTIKDVDTEVPLPGKKREFQQGEIVIGRVAKIFEGSGLNVQVGPHDYGRVFLTDVNDCYSRQTLAQQFSEWQIVRCFVLEADSKRISLSMRQSRVDPASFAAARADADEQDEEESVIVQGERWQSEIESYSDLAVGQRVAGFVLRTSAKGATIALGRDITAFVPLRELSDAAIRHPEKVFPAGKMVFGSVLNLDADKKSLLVSLKKSRAEPKRRRLHLNELSAGDSLKGTIKSIIDNGVFVRVEHASFDAFVHVSSLRDAFVKDISSLGLKVGDAVRCVVTSVDTKRRRVGASMKESDLAAAPEDESDSSSDSSDSDEEVAEDDYFSASDSDDSEAESGSSDEYVGVDGESGSDGESPSHGVAAVPWSTPGNDSDADHDASDEEMPDAGNAEQSASARRREARKRTKDKAAAIDAAEHNQQSLIEGLRDPQTAPEFEKALMSNPGSSELWIKFMAYYVSLEQIARARKTATRALETIPQEHLKEKRNIWIALLNLEHEHGTHADLLETFQRACQFNDVKDMFLHLVQLYEESDDLANANATWLTVSKKFGNSARVWRKYFGFLCRTNQLSEFRSELDRALAALQRKKHAEIIVSAAVSEFRYGTAERGRTLFEGVVQGFPSRTDAWSVWLDQELRPTVLATPDHARRIFERVTTLNLSTKKMKYFFKRWLQFERDHGTETEVEHVKDRASAFVQSKMGSK